METSHQLEQGLVLPLMELFGSIQGEGFHTGEAAIFVRIGGCDVGCHWCDIKESWNPELHPLTATDTIIKQVMDFPVKSVVVTGGEPLLYNLNYLCSELKKKGVRTYLETSGSEPLTGEWDWICLSPKLNSPPLDAIYNKAHELKVIITKEDDLKWAEINAAKVSPDCYLCLQPEWSRRAVATPLIVNYIGHHPKWKLSLQTHKYIGIP